MTPITKVDAHHHLWTFAAVEHYPMLSAPPARRYFGEVAGLQHEFGLEQFAALATPCNVVKSVYVESGFAPPEQEVAFVHALAGTNPFPHAVIGRADLAAADLGHRLDSDQRYPRFRGLRLFVNWDEDPLFRSAARGDLLQNPAWIEGYAELGRRGLLAEVMAMPSQLLDLAKVAERHPGTRLVINHAGSPVGRTPAENAAWRVGLQALAGLPQVTIKISGLGMFDHDWTPERIAPVVLEIIDIFGAERCLFASNFPVDGLHATYAEIWAAFETITLDLPRADRMALFHDNAVRLYQLA